MTTIKSLIQLLSSYNQNQEITDEQLRPFVHIRSLKSGQTILSTSRPIGICNRTSEKVYPSVVHGYSAYSPELDEDLFEFEFTRTAATDLVQPSADEVHDKLRTILQDYNNPEWGDCIIDEICELFNFPKTEGF